MVRNWSYYHFRSLYYLVHLASIILEQKKEFVNMFLWRNVIPAVESDDDVMSAYPYSNDALYIDNVINFYLKRQDPEAINGLYYYDMCPDIEGKIKTESNYEYIPESEVLC